MRKYESILESYRFWVLLVVVALATADSAWAQGCVMCKTSLTGQAAGLIQALNLGIIILLVPPLAILSTILLIVFRRDRSEWEGNRDLTG